MPDGKEGYAFYRNNLSVSANALPLLIEIPRLVIITPMHTVSTLIAICCGASITDVIRL